MALKNVDFKKRFHCLAENDLNSDCEFIVGPQETIIRGHKLIFSTASEVFQSMFFGDLREEKQVRIEDLDEDGFRGMKTFIYTSEISFKSTDQALSTYLAARKYMITDLTNECVRYVKENFKPLGVLKLLDFCLKNVITEFNDLCRKIIQEKSKEVLESRYFVSASAPTIEFILKCPKLSFDSEIYLFGHFERWALAEAERRNIPENCVATSFEDLKKNLRFPRITADEFVSIIKPSRLLTQDEKYSIALWKMEYDSKFCNMSNFVLFTPKGLQLQKKEQIELCLENPKKPDTLMNNDQISIESEFLYEFDFNKISTHFERRHSSYLHLKSQSIELLIGGRNVRDARCSEKHRIVVDVYVFEQYISFVAGLVVNSSVSGSKLFIIKSKFEALSSEGDSRTISKHESSFIVFNRTSYMDQQFTHLASIPRNNPDWVFTDAAGGKLSIEATFTVELHNL